MRLLQWLILALLWWLLIAQLSLLVVLSLLLCLSLLLWWLLVCGCATGTLRRPRLVHLLGLGPCAFILLLRPRLNRGDLQWARSRLPALPQWRLFLAPLPAMFRWARCRLSGCGLLRDLLRLLWWTLVHASQRLLLGEVRP
jgi:hypothetical protein